MKRIVLAMSFLVCCVMMNAQSDTEREMLEKIKETNAAYTSVIADFEQIKHMAIFDEDILSGGRLYYVKPDKLSMWYDNPEGDLMLINGDKFIMIASGRRNETTSKNAKMRSMKAILSACLEGDVRQVETTAVECEETPRYYVVTAELATGKNNKSNISRVVVSYDKTDCSLSVLRTEESDGTYNVYELKGKMLNRPVEEDVFISQKN